MLSIIPDLDKHPTTYAIAEQLGISLHTAIGYAVSMHGFLAKHGTRNGRKLVIPHGTPERIDTILGIPGLTQALIDTGLVTDDLDFAQFSNYLLGKKLTSNAKRQAKHREQKKAKAVTPSVTPGITLSVTDAEVVAETPAAPVVTAAVQVVEAEVCPDAFLTFPTVGAVKSWHLLADHVQTWQEAYPSVDVLGECRKALAWVMSNPTKTKTARGMPAFLNSWLARANDRPSGNGGYQTAAERTEEIQRRLGAELLGVET